MPEEFCTAQVNGLPCMSVRDLFEWAESQGCADLPMKFGSAGSMCNVITDVDIAVPAYADTELVDLYYEPAV